jgi:membrane protease YdiL (CAAX protease family)
MPADPNSAAAIQSRADVGKILWAGAVLIVFARFVFAILAQGLVALVYASQGSADPWIAAAPWWTVDGTLVDIGCLLLLCFFARHEGIRLWDLISFDRKLLGRDLLLSLGIGVISFIVGFGAGVIVTIALYGTSGPPQYIGNLPPWATWYSLLIWPVIWAFAEQMTYQGYALPRLVIFFRSALIAILFVGFGWALQHVAMPLLPDPKFWVFRFFSSLPIGLVLPILYLRIRRLLPFIIAHWFFNFLAVLTQAFLPMIGR